MTREPAYLQIASDVRRRIRSHELPPGSALPSYRGLSQRYRVSLSTAQRAVRLLRELGLAIGVPGKGVFVAREPHVRSTVPHGAASPARRQCGPSPSPSRRLPRSN